MDGGPRDSSGLRIDSGVFLGFDGSCASVLHLRSFDCRCDVVYARVQLAYAKMLNFGDILLLQKVWHRCNVTLARFVVRTCEGILLARKAQQRKLVAPAETAHMLFCHTYDV